MVVMVIFIRKLLGPTLRKKYSSHQENICKFNEFAKYDTIYLNSEKSEQFLVTECFFNLFLKNNKLAKKYWNLEIGSLSTTLNFTSHSHFEGFFFLCSTSTLK